MLFSAQLRTAPLATAVALVMLPASALAQTSQSPLPGVQQKPVNPQIATPAPAAAPSASSSAKTIPVDKPFVDDRHYSSRELSERPYTPNLPAPLYPSSPRVQKQFTVRYQYNYAESTYKPPVPVPQIARSAANRSTPEGAVIALYSAIRSGDYEAWLKCWDEPSRKTLEDYTATKKNGAEFWRSMWRNVYGSKHITMTDRIETVLYVMIDLQIDDAAKPANSGTESQVLTLKQGDWLLTNALGNDGLIMNLHTPENVSGVVEKDYEVRPAKDLVGPATLTGQAQKQFLSKHTKTNAVTETVE